MKKYANTYKNALINAVNHDGFEFAGYLAFLGLLAIFHLWFL